MTTWIDDTFRYMNWPADQKKEEEPRGNFDSTWTPSGLLVGMCFREQEHHLGLAVLGKLTPLKGKRKRILWKWRDEDGQKIAVTLEPKPDKKSATRGAR